MCKAFWTLDHQNNKTEKDQKTRVDFLAMLIISIIREIGRASSKD